jgi:hypothetical protein
VNKVARTCTTLGAFLLFSCVCATGALAQQAVWSCAGKQVLRLHATAGGVTPEKRVEMLDERVNNVLSKHSTVAASDITIVKDRGQVYIAAFGQVLVTVTPDDAAANNTTPARLAHTWLTNLRGTLPQLSPRVNKHGA